MNRFLPLLACTALAALLPAQAAVVPYGTGCTFQNQVLAIGNQGLPQIGTTFQLTYSGPNYTFSSAQQIAWPHLVLGLNQQSLPIPQTILPQQPPGCTAWLSPTVFLPANAARTGSMFENFVAVPVPNNPSLVGWTIFAQWLLRFEQCGFAGCNIAAVPTSDGAAVTLGL